VPAGRRLRVLRSERGVSRVAFSPGGALIAAAGRDGAARIWHVATGKLSHALKGSRLPVTDVAFSPDGRLLLTTGLIVRTWDARSGAPLHTLVGHTGPVSGGAFSSDGRWIVTAGPTTAGLWLRNADRPPFFLRSTNTAAQHKLLTSASFSPDGRRVLTSSEDGSVRVYTCEICGDLPALERLASSRLASLRRGFIPKK
jgi:WD40 repeat protein